MRLISKFSACYSQKDWKMSEITGKYTSYLIMTFRSHGLFLAIKAPVIFYRAVAFTRRVNIRPISDYLRRLVY